MHLAMQRNISDRLLFENWDAFILDNSIIVIQIYFTWIVDKPGSEKYSNTTPIA